MYQELIAQIHASWPALFTSSGLESFSVRTRTACEAENMSSKLKESFETSHCSHDFQLSNCCMGSRNGQPRLAGFGAGVAAIARRSGAFGGLHNLLTSVQCFCCSMDMIRAGSNHLINSASSPGFCHDCRCPTKRGLGP